MLPAFYGDRVSVGVTTRADPREAERKTDERYLRMTGMPIGSLIDGTAMRLPNIRSPIAAEQDENIFTEGQLMADAVTGMCVIGTAVSAIGGLADVIAIRAQVGALPPGCGVL